MYFQNMINTMNVLTLFANLNQVKALNHDILISKQLTSNQVNMKLFIYEGSKVTLPGYKKKALNFINIKMFKPVQLFSLMWSKCGQNLKCLMWKIAFSQAKCLKRRW